MKERTRSPTELANAAQYFLAKQSSKLRKAEAWLEGKGVDEDEEDMRSVMERLKDIVWGCRYGIWVVVFYVAHVFLWMAFEPTWSPMQSIYFITASLTTVGYGDISATDDHGRLYSIFFLLVGLAAVTSVISGWMNRVLEELEVYLIAQPDEGDAKAEEEGDGNMEVVVSNSTYRYRKIIFSAVIIALCITCGTIYMCVTHEWTFLKAFYWSFVTALTVGYGDVSFWHDDGTLAFVSVFMMVSTMCVAVALGNFVEVTVEIEQEEKKKRCLDELDLTELLLSDTHKYDEIHKAHNSAQEAAAAAATATEGSQSPAPSPRRSARATIRHSSKEELVKELHGKEVTKLDFMLFMLEKLNDLDRKKDIDPLLKKFDMFDSDKTGTLNIHDIQECSETFAAEKKERKRREMEGQFSIMGLFARSTSTEPGGSAKVVPGSDPDQQTQEVVEVVDNPA